MTIKDRNRREKRSKRDSRLVKSVKSRTSSWKLHINPGTLVKSMQNALTMTKSEHVLLTVETSPEGNAQIVIVATGNDVQFKQVVVGTIDQLGPEPGLGLDVNVLTGIARGRKEMCLFTEPDDTRIHFSSKGANGRAYSGDVCSVPDIAFAVDSIAPSKDDVILDQSIRTALQTAVNRVGLTDVVEGKELDLWVQANMKGLTVACFDTLHVATLHFSELKVKRDFNLNLPLSTFTTIQGLTESGEFTIGIADNTITAYSDEFFVSMPLLQETARTQSLADVLSLLQTITSNGSPEASFTCSVEDLNTALGSTNAVFETGAKTRLTVEKKTGVTINIKTSYGQVNDQVANDNFTGSGEFVISQPLLEDILRVYSDDKITLKLYNDKPASLLSATGKVKDYTYTYIALLMD
ncbi:hypothetical protein Pori4_00233 [Pseudomonas phage vB_PpuM-Pori-4]